MTNSATPVIQLDQLSVQLGGRPILHQLAVSLQGRTIGLLGPNGAGKSTLINTLLGFYAPASGTARVFGHDIHKDTRFVRSLVGFMPENDSFIAGMSAVSYIRMMGELSGLPPATALERAGMRTLTEGQKVVFETQVDRRNGKMAVSNIQAA